MVQFMYGGDGLDPTDMEGKDKPLDYNRVFSHVQVSLSKRMQAPRAIGFLFFHTENLFENLKILSFISRAQEPIRWTFHLH